MFVIRSGEVEVYHGQPEGNRTVVATYRPRDFFGEMALLTGNPRNANVRALTPVTLFQLSRTEFDGLLQKYPGMRAILERTAAERMALEASSKPI